MVSDFLRQRLLQLDRKVVSFESRKRDRERSLRDLQTELSGLLEQTDLLFKVDQVLLAVSSKVLGQSTDTIDKLVTAGLRLVFDDQKLEFKAEAGKARGKTAIEFKLFQDGVEKPIMEAYGGGVIAMTGVLLRIVVIMTLNLKRILLLDESLAHVSDQYVSNCSKLLKSLADRLSFTIVLVTHQPAFADSADFHYEAFEQNSSTHFKTVRQPQPTALPSE